MAGWSCVRCVLIGAFWFGTPSISCHRHSWHRQIDVRRSSAVSRIEIYKRRMGISGRPARLFRCRCRLGMVFGPSVLLAGPAISPAGAANDAALGRDFATTRHVIRRNSANASPWRCSCGAFLVSGAAPPARRWPTGLLHTSSPTYCAQAISLGVLERRWEVAGILTVPELAQTRCSATAGDVAQRSERIMRALKLISFYG